MVHNSHRKLFTSTHIILACLKFDFPFKILTKLCSLISFHICTIFPFLNQNIIFPKTLFFFFWNYYLWMGVNKILAFIILNVFLHLRKIFFRLSDQMSILCNCHNPKGILVLKEVEKRITRLRLGLSHSREHKFKHNVQKSLNPLCNCGHSIESTTHFFLHCPLFTNERYTLLSFLSSIDCNFLSNIDFKYVDLGIQFVV